MSLSYQKLQAPISKTGCSLSDLSTRIGEQHETNRSAIACAFAWDLVTCFRRIGADGKTGGSGLSTERLQRIHELIQRYMDGGNFTGAVTLVARRGRIAHFEAQGLMDIDAKKPMTKDAISASCR